MKKIYTTFIAAVFSVALFGQINIQDNSAINNGNTNKNIVSYNNNSSDLKLELEKMKVYPNPVSDELRVNITDISFSIPKIEVFDITGRLIKSINVEDNTVIRIDFSDQRKGLYLLSFYNQSGEVIKISKVQKI